jgi:hypothetical protein
MDKFSASTVPGCRTPHLWLRDGRSLYDAMGRWYTLLRFDSKVDVKNLIAAAEKRGVPFQVLDVDSAEAAGIYDHAIVLSRPDQHVAWRGDREPADALALIDLIRGAGRKSARRAA